MLVLVFKEGLTLAEVIAEWVDTAMMLSRVILVWVLGLGDEIHTRARQRRLRSWLKSQGRGYEEGRCLQRRNSRPTHPLRFYENSSQRTLRSNLTGLVLDLDLLSRREYTAMESRRSDMRRTSKKVSFTYVIFNLVAMFVRRKLAYGET